MAGFLPDALPPISISRTPIATNRRRASRYATPLDSPISTSSPTTMLSRSQPRPSGSWSFRTEPLNHPDLPDFTSATLHASTPLSLHGRMSLALNSPERPSPTPVPQRTNSVPKMNPRLFNRGTSFRDSPSKDKRKKLVKKSLAQPTFEMLNPTQVRFDADEEAKAAQLDEQLAELVAELEREYASGEGDDATIDNAHMPGQDNEPARPRASYLKPNSPDGNHDPAKRWSHAPLLPELDFSPSDSESSLLFDPETHTPPPSAKIHISTMASINMGTLDLKHTSSDSDKLTYRCDIYAENGASHRSIEEACQEVVANAGGQILDSYFYPGGFLYSLPPGIVEPLTTCELPMHEAKVEVHGWAAFPEARLDGLRMHPPEGQLGSERPLSVSTMTSGLKLRRDTGVDLVEAWTKSEGVAMIMDLPVPTEKSEEEPVIENKESENKTHNKASDVETPITTPITTPTRKPAIMKSLETLRRRAARSISSSSPPSIPLPFSVKKSPGTSNENRFTAVLDRSVGHSEGEGGSGSGAEDWESVQSEMQT